MTKNKDDYVMLNELTESQWKEIRSLARKIYDSGQFQGDQFKIAIIAFIQWLLNRQDSQQVMVEVNEETDQIVESNRTNKITHH